MDPTLDLLALPAAAFVLGVQVLTGDLSSDRARRTAGPVCTALLAGLCALVWAVPPAVEGGGIGAALLLLGLLASLGLLVAPAPAGVRRRRTGRRRSRRAPGTRPARRSPDRGGGDPGEVEPAHGSDGDAAPLAAQVDGQALGGRGARRQLA